MKKSKPRGKNNRDLHVREALWWHVKSCAGYLAQEEPGRDFTLWDWVKQALLILEKSGYAARHVDENNNLVFEATPALLASAECDPGALLVIRRDDVTALSAERAPGRVFKERNYVH